MKKYLILLLIPVLIVGIKAASTISDLREEPSYDLSVGNTLSNLEFLSNKYVETKDKEIKEYDMEIPESFEFVSENEFVELYLERETLGIAVRVKENGYVYSSYNFNDTFVGETESVVNDVKSGVSLDLYIDSTPTSISYLETKAPPTGGEKVPVADSVITITDTGFIANIDFYNREIQVKFDLEVRIENDSIVIHVPNESIEEYNPNLWNEEFTYHILRNIVVYEFFGSVTSVPDGYVLIPDGSGALISLEANPEISATFSLDVYGDDLGYLTPTIRNRSLSVKPPKRVTMPIFGMVHDVGNTGFLSVIEEGANYSELKFKTAGLINDYYTTYFTYRFRESYQQYQSRSNEDQFRIAFQDDINDYDITQKYFFLSGSNANYVGMAKKYQSYLQQQDLLGDKNRSEYSQTPLKIDFVGQEISLGVLSMKQVEVTSYDQVQSTLSDMQKDGFTELIASYKTFDKGNMSYDFDVYRRLGGKSDFKSLMSYLDENGISFNYELDYVRSYEYYTRQHAQTLSKRDIFYIEPAWMFVGHNVNDPKYYEEFAKEDIEDLSDFGISGVALDGFDRAVFTSYDDGLKSSSRNMEDIRNTLALFNSNNIRAGVYNPDAYLFDQVDEYYDAPLSSSDFSFTSASIPFVQLVVGGYMDMYSEHLNFASDEDVTLLRLVEFGVFPSYVLTGESTYTLKKTNSSHIYISEYDVLQTRIKDYYSKVDEGLTATIGKEMIDHTYLSQGVVSVTYDDNTQIIINYNNTEYDYNGITIPSVGYKVIS